ncbi:Na-translocating system protein MpsC family protein [Patulibacter sp. SYSU D01012]|uniref:Na-translocating system protein MpsC family protein n=1 Tax=Patulibacter sp. SYSU D01012 TaxID=2817381 RepID=UPI001B303D67|nr:Na-translocating system protein MpsC family protein [Patulibacter sp. SYSU D01012]
MTPPEEHDVLAVVSDAMAHFHKTRVGRGPVRIETRHAGQDAVVCVLHGSMTTLERTLRDQGLVDQVRDLRRTVNDEARDELAAVVAEATGRRVLTMLTAIDPHADIATKVFVLDPAGR